MNRLKVFSFSLILILSLTTFAHAQVLEKDVVYDHVGSKSLKMDVYSPKVATLKAAPSLIYIHGGCFSGGSKSDIPDYLQNLTQEGVVVFSLDYRLSDEALYPAGVIDLQQALRFIRQNAERFHIDAQKMVVHGESAGAYLAANMGVQSLLDRQGHEDQWSAPAPLISEWFGRMDFTLPQNEGGVDCASSFLGKERSAKNLSFFQAASILPKVTAQASLFHVVQGTYDHQVYSRQSVLLANKFWNLNKELILTLAEGEHHGFVGKTPWLLTHAFLRQHWQLQKALEAVAVQGEWKHKPATDFVVEVPTSPGVYEVDLTFAAKDLTTTGAQESVFDLYWQVPEKLGSEKLIEAPVLLQFQAVNPGQKEVHRRFQVISQSADLRLHFKAEKGLAFVTRIDVRKLSLE